MTFAQSNKAVGNTIKFLAGLFPVLAAGMFMGSLVGFPFSFMFQSAEGIAAGGVLGMLLASLVYAAEVDKAGKLP